MNLLNLKKVVNFIRNYFKRYQVFFDYYFNNGKSSYPRAVSFNLTYYCNLRCQMCGQWGKSGYLHQEKPSNLKKIINFGKIKEIIDEVSPYNSYIYLWGGEPFLHPEIMKIIEYLNYKKLPFAINTNGTLLNKFAPKLVNKNYRYDLTVSLDAPNSVHDRIRGVPGTFIKVSSGIRKIQKIKRQLRILEPKIEINSVIGHESSETLIELARVVNGFKVDQFTISLPWFISEEKGKKYAQIMKNNFNCKAESWKGFINGYQDIDIEKLKKDIKLVLHNTQTKTSLNIPIQIKDIGKYLNNLEFSLHKNRCFAPWCGVDIRPDGNITFCPDYPDYIIGNIYQDSLLKIWNGRKAQKFRKYLKKNKKLPICNRCCRLYNFPQ